MGYNLVEEDIFHEKSRFGGVVNTLPCYMPGNPFGGVGSNPAGDVLHFAFFPEAACLSSAMAAKAAIFFHLKCMHVFVLSRTKEFETQSRTQDATGGTEN